MSITFKPVYTIPPFPTGVLFEGIKDTSRSGAGNGDIYNPKLLFYSVFDSFLGPKLLPRATKSGKVINLLVI